MDSHLTSQDDELIFVASSAGENHIQARDS